MSNIKIMSSSLANKIAAGEVVERISSVVKELVENSIDAGSKNIKVELEECGIKSIKIVDDGCGMSKEDAILCFERHATSKIKTDNDLFFINTLGFRGEALAAISSVSYIELDTYDGNESTLINVNAGKIEKTTIGSKRKGTSIKVSKLFFNTPARLKFLKSLNTELSNVVQVLEKISMSSSNISFILINDGKEILHTTGSGDLYKTIHEIYGFATSKNMMHIHNETYDYIIDGYISNINVTKSSRNNMITLVNNRVVSNKDINRIIKEAYHCILADNRYPVVVLNISVDPTMIDVNIHPTKQDIKFSKLDMLLDLIFNTIKEKLNESDNTFNGYIEFKKEDKNYNEYKNYDELDTKEDIEFKIEEPINNYSNVENLRLSFDEKIIVKEKESSFIKPVGLALGTYLVAQDEDIIYLIDIHAANERINYEKYINALKENKIYKINMLVPVTIELPTNEYMNIKNNINVLIDLGFDIEEFGINTFRVLAHPNYLKEGHEEENIRMIFELVGEINKDFDRVRFCEKTAITLACKSSVKANTSITLLEMETLIDRLFKCDFPYTCPHGRPTIIKYPKYELEKIFKRVD